MACSSSTQLIRDVLLCRRPDLQGGGSCRKSLWSTRTSRRRLQTQGRLPLPGTSCGRLPLPATLRWEPLCQLAQSVFCPASMQTLNVPCTMLKKSGEEPNGIHIFCN